MALVSTFFGEEFTGEDLAEDCEGLRAFFVDGGDGELGVREGEAGPCETGEVFATCEVAVPFVSLGTERGPVFIGEVVGGLFLTASTNVVEDFVKGTSAGGVVRVFAVGGSGFAHGHAGMAGKEANGLKDEVIVGGGVEGGLGDGMGDGVGSSSCFGDCPDVGGIGGECVWAGGEVVSFFAGEFACGEFGYCSGSSGVKCVEGLTVGACLDFFGYSSIEPFEKGSPLAQCDVAMFPEERILEASFTENGSIFCYGL